MWHKPCRTFHPWCVCIKTRCLLPVVITTTFSAKNNNIFSIITTHAYKCHNKELALALIHVDLLVKYDEMISKLGVVQTFSFDFLTFWNGYQKLWYWLPERTRGRPWGRLRVRIRSIEKTSSWKFYPAAQNFTNRMLFRNTYIFKTI